MRSTATDDIYVNRHLSFHLIDGRILSSRDLNWHHVLARSVMMLELNIRNRIYRVRRQDLPSSFVEFIHFRTKGTKFNGRVDGEVLEPEQYNSWTIGWTDGQTEYLCEIDFQTGAMVRNYEQPLSVKSHLHPDSLVLERGTR